MDLLGEIKKHNTNSYISYGKYQVLNKAQIEINELPIRSWTDKYKEYLETLLIETGKDKKSHSAFVTIVHRVLIP